MLRGKITATFSFVVATFLAYFAAPLCAALLCTNSAAQEPVNFNHDIRPLLSKHCIACHGPDEGDRQADLRLDTFEGATDYAISPGDAEGSDFIDRVSTDDEDMRMPPADHADALKPAEIELLKRWVDEGAKYQTHWSFAPITKPAVSEIKLTVAESGDDKSDQAPTVNNAIDNFILAKVYEAGLNQNAAANPASLVRRVSLDLTGIPPNSHGPPVQKAIKAYRAQPTQENFGGLVDQLFETPSYAEHWASVWLDLARYADTCGYAGDEQRDIWPWRDWLIQSIESKKSYKTMSIEMLAGDMLLAATSDQKLATAFHRNTLANNEGGTDDEEFRTIAVKDRLSTTLNGWMGLTVRCAECHSHKYDPISHHEYYSLLDFFNQTVDADNRDDRPKLEVQPTRDPAELAELNSKIEKLKSQLDDQPKIWTSLRPEKMTSREGTEFELLDDDSILAHGPLPGREEYQFTFSVAAGTTVRAIRLEALPHIKNDGNVGRAPEGAFILSQFRVAKIEPSDQTADTEAENVETSKDVDGKDVVEARAGSKETDAQAGGGKEADGGKEAIAAKETILALADAANDFNQPNQHAKTAIQPDVESGGKQGWAVNHPADGYKGRHEAIFELKEPLVANEPTKFIVYLLHDPPWERLNMGCVRISISDAEDSVAKYDKKELDQVNRELTALLTKQSSPVRVPVMEERPENQKRETHINLRGNFQSKGDKVAAKFPEAFPPADDSIELNRLGLAQWLFDENNPLTARVAANRYWARLMGIGLVETEEDFGTQGTPPTHPELLDYLASEFRDGGWDDRDLQKLIVMSATYQQSQTLTKQKVELDPRNRLLARGPRVRLAAEVVRDQALAVSGLLSNKLYGKPVYPPSPLKNVVNAFTGGMKWQESKGADRYRRAIYTFLKRSAPHPLFETFDMASRDICSMRRQRTNTPLQSFMTLNDITFIEAARALAGKMLDSDPSDSAEKTTDEQTTLNHQIDAGIEAALYAPADDFQHEVLSTLYRNSVKKYESDLKAAAEMVGRDKKDFDPEKISDAEKTRLVQHASMTVVANAILNLDTFLNN